MKKPRNGSVWHFSSKLDVPSNVLQKKRVARILVFKIRPSQEINKIRDGTLLEAEEILTYRKKPRNGSVWHFSSKLDVPSNVLQNKRVAQILVFKIRPSQEINKIRDGTPLEAEGILTYRKKPRNGSVWPSQEILIIRDGTPSEPRNGSVWHFSSKLDVPSNVLQKKRVARILVFKIRPSQEINKIRDGTLLEAEEILTYRKKPRNGSVWHFSSKLDVPSNVLQKKRVAQILVFKIRPSQEILIIRDGTPSEIRKKRVARILFFKIRPSQEINKIRDGTLLEAEEILTYRKKPRNGSVCHFSSKLDVPSNVLQKKRVARIQIFKIRPSQEINKIRDGTLLEAEEILTYRKKPRNGPVWYFSSKLDVPSNKKRVARIQIFKIRPSQEINKIRDGTPLEAEEILTYRKKPRNRLVWHFSSKLDVPSNVLQKKRVARILVFKIRPSQEILIIRDGTPLDAEEILTYIKKPSKQIVWHFSSKLDVPSNILQKKRVARILFFKIWPSQEILKIGYGTPLEKKRVARIQIFKIRPSQEINKIRDGTPLEKRPRNGSVWHFSSKLDVPSNVLQKKRVARILVFKIRPSQEINKIRDGTLLEAEEILTYRKKPRNGSVWHFSSKLDVPSNVLQKKRVAQILVFKIRPSQEINKIRDSTPLEAEGILTYRKKPRNGSVWHFSSKKKPRNGSVWHFSSKLDVPSNVLQKKRVARILVFKIRPSQEINKIRDGTLLEAEEILTYRKKPRNGSVWHFSSKLDVPSNVLQKKRVAQILVFKIRPSQEILIIRDGTPSEAEEILTYIKGPRNGSIRKKRVARILFFKIRPSQEINKIRDGTLLEAEEILIYRKKPRNGSVCHFSSKLDVPSNVLHKKRVAQILVFKSRPSQEILKIRDGTPSEKKRVARILVFKIRPSQEILKIRDVMSSQEILKIRDGTPLEKKRVARILFFKIRPSQEINKIRDGTLLEAEEILIYRKKPRNGSVCHFSSKLDVPSNVLQKKRVAQILVFKISKLDVPSNVLQKKRVARILIFKIRPSQEINKIRDGTPLEAEEILTYRKKPRNGSVWYFSIKLDIPSNILQKKRVARILVFKIRPSQEILIIRDGTPSELDVPSNVVRKKRVARILFFKIRPSQEINKIRDGTLLEAEEILIYRKKPRNGSVYHFSSKLDVPSNVLQKKRVAQILVFKIRPSQEILKIRDGTPSEAEEILTYRKKP
ncbi:hypothetical protein OROMI_012985 [Orobanche minor]